MFSDDFSLWALNFSESILCFHIQLLDKIKKNEFYLNPATFICHDVIMHLKNKTDCKKVRWRFVVSLSDARCWCEVSASGGSVLWRWMCPSVWVGDMALHWCSHLTCWLMLESLYLFILIKIWFPLIILCLLSVFLYFWCFVLMFYILELHTAPHSLTAGCGVIHLIMLLLPLCISIL